MGIIKQNKGRKSKTLLKNALSLKMRPFIFLQAENAGAPLYSPFPDGLYLKRSSLDAFCRLLLHALFPLKCSISNVEE